MVKQGKSSEILDLLYGKTDHLGHILTPHIKKLVKTYPDKNLLSIFSSLERKIISIAPMKFSEALALDLGKKIKNEELAALGLHMLAISTHDDVVDELPSKRIETASLIYAGNIASNAGSQLLLNQKDAKAAIVLLDKINQNHYRQQKIVQSLWVKPPKTFSEYEEGVRHICVFIEIGLEYTLSIFNRYDLVKKIRTYAEGYGVALQLVDDLREIEEDKKFGYWSYPILEGKPYTRSFKELFKHIQLCKNSIPKSWKNLQELAIRLEKFAQSIHE